MVSAGVVLVANSTFQTLHFLLKRPLSHSHETAQTWTFLGLNLIDHS